MWRLAFGLLLLFSITNCAKDKVVEGTGAVIYVELEGGFYGIVADDGKDYDPINLPKEFEMNGLRVRFNGKIRDDLPSFHMWGEMIELLDIYNE